MTTTDRGRPLVRPGFLKGSIVAFALLIPVVAYTVWGYVETRRLNAAIAAIVRNGEPVSEPYRRLTGQAAEADRTYRAAATLAEGLFSDMPTAFFSRLGEAEREGVFPPDVASRMRELTDRYRESVTLAERAAALPFEGFAPGASGRAFGFLNSGLASLVRLLGLEAAVRAFDGDGAGAANALYAEGLIEKESQFFARARLATDLRIAAEHVRLPAAGLARLEGVLASLDVDERPKREWQRFRAEVLRQFQLTRASSPVIGYRVVPPWFAHELNQDLDIFAKLVTAADGPWPGRIDRVVAIGEWPSRLGGSRTDLRALLNEDMVRHAQDLAIVRSMRLVVAIERHRRAHGEKSPARLEDMVPEYLTALPIDPFSGKPLIMAAEANGYVVYSVGANRRDEGGGDVNAGFASATAWPRGLYTNDSGIRIRYR